MRTTVHGFPVLRFLRSLTQHLYEFVAIHVLMEPYGYIVDSNNDDDLFFFARVSGLFHSPFFRPCSFWYGQMDYILRTDECVKQWDLPVMVKPVRRRTDLIARCWKRFYLIEIWVFFLFFFFYTIELKSLAKFELFRNHVHQLRELIISRRRQSCGEPFSWNE